MSATDLLEPPAPPVRLVATARLALTEAEWPRFRRLLAEIAAADGWTLRDSSHPRGLGGTLARGDVQVSYKQWAWASPAERAATVFVVARRGDEAWRAPVHGLFDRLATAWPGALTV